MILNKVFKYYACDKSERMMNVLLATSKIKIRELKGFRDFVQNEDGSEHCTYMKIGNCKIYNTENVQVVIQQYF